MNKQRSLKNQPDPSVAERLIETAEALYGQHGLDGVSLRQISQAAGTGNNYAVQYHFGDASGLIRAILQKRAPEVELMRARHLAKIKEEGCLSDVRRLSEILYRPLIEHVNGRGERACARFVLALFSSPTGLEHTMGLSHLWPIADHVLDLIHAATPEIPLMLIRERHRLISFTVLTSVFNRRAPYAQDDFDAALIENALDMATAATVAPLGNAVRKMMGQIASSKR